MQGCVKQLLRYHNILFEIGAGYKEFQKRDTYRINLMTSVLKLQANPGKSLRLFSLQCGLATSTAHKEDNWARAFSLNKFKTCGIHFVILLRSTD